MRFCTKLALSLLIITFITVNISSVNAQIKEDPLFLFRGARPLGLGNAFEAIADDINAIHYNPAGLAQVDETLIQILVSRGRLTKDLITESQTIDEFIDDTINPLVDSDDPLTDPALANERERLVERAEALLAKEIAFDLGGPSFGIVTPMSIGKYKAGIGMSIYTQLVGSARTVEVGLPWTNRVIEALDNPVFYRVALQGTLATAFSIEIPVDRPFLRAFNLGTGIRLIRRGTFTDIDDPFAIEDTLNPDVFKEKYFDLDDDDDFFDFARKNVDSKTGYSVDFGALFFPTDGLRVGFAWRNAFSNINVELSRTRGNEVKVNREFPPNFVVAVAAKPLELLGQPTESLDLTVAASWDDPNGDDLLGEFELDSFTDHLHLGAEVVLWPKELVSLALRAGDNQGFATFGATLRLFRFLNLDVVRYGDLRSDWWVGSVEIGF